MIYPLLAFVAEKLWFINTIEELRSLLLLEPRPYHYPGSHFISKYEYVIPK